MHLFSSLPLHYKNWILLYIKRKMYEYKLDDRREGLEKNADKLQCCYVAVYSSVFVRAGMPLTSA
jgi:hypothetical protein